MGLTPGVQKRVSQMTAVLHRPREIRCSLVLDAWKTLHAGGVDLDEPRHFLYREHQLHGGGTKGDLRASQTFLRYVRYNWLSLLERRIGPKDGLFAPSLFFRTPGEIEAYQQHMATR